MIPCLLAVLRGKGDGRDPVLPTGIQNIDTGDDNPDSDIRRFFSLNNQKSESVILSADFVNSQQKSENNYGKGEGGGLFYFEEIISCILIL